MSPFNKRRAFGQHFLKDRTITQQIAETVLTEAKRGDCQALLEIGPGKGAITEPILAMLKSEPAVPKLILCEKDRILAQRWKDEALSSHFKLQIEEADFLELTSQHWLQSTPLAVVSNLPYSAGTRILTTLAKYPHKITVMVLMFQAEVAHRLRATSGTKDWGSLSIWIQNRWDVKKLVSVPPRSFSPPPQVNSEVVILTPRALARIPNTESAENEALFENLVKTCFAHRRKMLRSSLPSSGIWREALAQSGIDGTRRAEMLGWEDWEKFFAAALRLR